MSGKTKENVQLSPEERILLMELCLDGEATPEESEQLAIEMEKDPAFARLWEENKLLRDMTESCAATPPLNLSQRVTENLTQVLREEEKKQNLRRKIRRRTLSAVAAAAACLTIGFVGISQMGFFWSGTANEDALSEDANSWTDEENYLSENAVLSDMEAGDWQDFAVDSFAESETEAASETVESEELPVTNEDKNAFSPSVESGDNGAEDSTFYSLVRARIFDFGITGKSVRQVVLVYVDRLPEGDSYLREKEWDDIAFCFTTTLGKDLATVSGTQEELTEEDVIGLGLRTDGDTDLVIYIKEEQ